VAAALCSILTLLFAVGLRLRYFSGLGLGDDYLLRADLLAIVRDGRVNFDANGYRFPWWIPTALSCRLLRVSEAGLIAPILVFDVLGMALVCLFARRLWGGAGGVIAALLVAVLPLDVAWSTMFASDVVVSFFSTLCLFFVVRALGNDDVARRGRAWTLAAVALWAAFHSKLSGLLLVPALVVIGWANRATLDAAFLRFVGTATLLFGGRLEETGRRFNAVEPNDVAKRRQQLAAVSSGFLVTGGGREPYYGCIACIPSAGDVTRDRWVLVKEFPSPIGPTGWRPEPLRIWEAKASP